MTYLNPVEGRGLVARDGTTLTIKFISEAIPATKPRLVNLTTNAEFLRNKISTTLQPDELPKIPLDMWLPCFYPIFLHIY
jgi:hypothetical protein